MIPIYALEWNCSHKWFWEGHGFRRAESALE